MQKIISHPFTPLTQASLILALGLGMTACKDTPSHTNTSSTPNNSVITPTTIGSNGAPAVDAGSRQIADTGVTVFLSGTARLAEGASVTQAEWVQISGPTVSLQNTHALNTQFISPQVDNTVQMVFKLTVTDDQSRSSSDTVRITINPLASTLLLSGGTADESSGTFEFTLTMPKPLAAPLVVRYSTRDGSAIGGEDYTIVNGELMLAAGTTSASLPVTLLNDDNAEAQETLTLNVITEVNGQSVQANATLFIRDDDEATPPTEYNPGDVLQAILERQSTFGVLSDGNTAEQLAGSFFQSQIDQGPLAGQIMDITLLEDSRYEFGEDGISNNQVSLGNEQYLLPITGRVLYSIEGATILADYVDGGFFVRMDLDNSNCVDARADLFYFDISTETTTAGLIQPVSEEPCETLEIDRQSGQETFDPIEIVDSDTQIDSQI